MRLLRRHSFSVSVLGPEYGGSEAKSLPLSSTTSDILNAECAMALSLIVYLSLHEKETSVSSMIV